MTKVDDSTTAAATEAVDAILALEQQLDELKRENDVLRAQLQGDIPTATFWLQTKVWRQRRALDRLNRRVLSQRLALRVLEELGRGLTREEYIAARAKLSDQLQERTDEEM